MHDAPQSNNRKPYVMRHPKAQPISLALIQSCADEIAGRFEPEKILLFGSWAYGNPSTESDIDLFIIMPLVGSPYRQAGKILNSVIQSIGVMPLDLLVRTPDQIRERLQIGDSLIRDILSQGKVLYEPKPT